MIKPSSEIRVVIMAGGTGGHVFPGLAVAKELQLRRCGVAWLGTQKGIEAKLVPAANIPIHYLNVQGLRGKKVTAMLKAPFRIAQAILQVRKWLNEFKPQVVVGLGGYAAGPGGIAAWSLGIPLVIHEQNARAGTTNKILSRFAKRILVAFDGALPRGECIGNPVREEFSLLPVEVVPSVPGDVNSPLRILILGGSLGAKAINEIVPKALAAISSGERPKVVHQTGEKHLEQTQALYKNCGVDAEVVPFIDDMCSALANADFVICRSGALTVAELSAAGVASLLIPFPYAIDDHQTANGQWLVSHGAAILRQQNQLTQKELTELMIEYSKDRTPLKSMAKAARACAKLNATQAFADVCLEVANG